MPVPCQVSIDAGTAITIGTAATLVIQGTNSASKPIRLKRIELESNQTGSTQQTVQVQLITYGTASGSGSTPAAYPIDNALIGVYTPATGFRAGTATLGVTPTNVKMWYWNTANPFDIVLGLSELQHEFGVSKIWAIVIPTAPGTSFSLTGTVSFEEFG